MERRKKKLALADPHQHEVNLNNNLAHLLNRMFPQSPIQPENTDGIVDPPGKRPEHLILMKPDKTAN